MPFAIRGSSGPRWTGRVELIESELGKPLHWRRPRRIFLNSISDTFHESVKDEWIDRIFAVMALCPQHTFLCLTKRAERMQRWATRTSGNHCVEALNIGTGHVRSGSWIDPLENAWFGVSVENQAALERVEHLRRTPAAVRFISAEPLLEDLGRINLDGISLVIVGGESGPGARPMHPAWVRSLRDQCIEAEVPFHFKQRGEWDWDQVDVGVEGESEDTHYINPDGSRGSGWVLESDPEVVSNYCGAEPDANAVWIRRIGKRAAGCLLDGREWRDFPQ
jgi:protein gp37